MKQPTIWFSRGLSGVAPLIEEIRACLRPGESFRILCSHTIANHASSQAADQFELEPSGLDDAAYVEYCLDFATRHEVDVFIPRHAIAALATQGNSFAAKGIKLIIPGTAETVRLLANKANLYEALGQDLVPIPDYKRADDAASFEAACVDLAARHKKICFKPTVGIGGRGFYILTQPGITITSSWSGEIISSTVGEALQRFALKQRFPEQMVMECLPGPERSVDCLAESGTLIAAIVRLKTGNEKEEVLEDNPAVVESVRKLTEKLMLSGLFNVQFLEGHDGKHYLLEINARMAGGTHLGARSGVCLPYWAIRLALGTATTADMPQPRTGLRIDRTTRTIIS